jgi:hypothetical protein
MVQANPNNAELQQPKNKNKSYIYKTKINKAKNNTTLDSNARYV